MDRAREMLRSGDWLTRERVRLIAMALLIASAAGFLFLVVTAHGVIDRQGRPLGTDFSNVYAAGTYVLDGNAAAPFDPPQQFAREQAIFGQATQFYGWHYPPFFLFVAAALAWMPYGLALAVWQAVTLGLYLLTMRAILKAPFPETGGAINSDPLWLLLALAFPAVLINIGHGQNGFLTAALLGGALVVLDRRPIVAGILLGLLVYKPQYGLMIPLVLAVSGRWKCFAAAAATVGLLALATTLTFGVGVWHAFLASTEFTRTVVLEQGNTGWYKIQSVFCLGAHVGRADPAGLRAARRRDCRHRRRAGLAVAQCGVLSAQGRGFVPRHHSRDALQLRLRHDGAGAGHCLHRGGWFRPQLRTVGENRAGGAVADAARRPQPCSNKSNSTRRAGHAGDFRSYIAAQRIWFVSGILRRVHYITCETPVGFRDDRRYAVRE